MLCQDCSKKPTCTELCSEAEKFVNQDYVSKDKIVIIPDIDTFLNPELDEDVWSYQKEQYSNEGLKWLIIQLHLDGKTPTEIAHHLPCTQPYIFKIITDFKSK